MKVILQVLSFDIASKALLAVLGMLLIRFMSPAEFALYTFALSVVAVASQALASSFNRIYIVAYTKLELKEDGDSFLGLQLAGAVVIIILGLFPLGQSLDDVYWVISALLLATCLSEFAKTFYQQGAQFMRYSLVELFRSVSMLILVLMLIFLMRYEVGAWQVLLIQAVAMFMVFGLFVGRYVNLKELIKMPKALRVARGIVEGPYRYLFGYFLLLSIFSQLDIFMLRLMASDLQLATYGSGFRYYSILLLALSAINAVLLPLVQNVRERKEMDAIFNKHKRMILTFSLVVVVGGWASQWIIPWVDGGKYPDAVVVFRILCVSTVISFAFSPYVNILMRFEKFGFLLFFICAGLILGIIINIGLIPIWGAVGTAIATLLASASINVPIYFKSRSVLNQLSL